VQSLGPASRQGRGRGSADPLLSRAIAVPAKPSRLPVLIGARRLIKPNPRQLKLGRLGRDRARGKWLLLCVLFLGASLVYGAIIGGQTGKLLDALKLGVDKLAVAAGFGVKSITVDGKVHATDAEITAALQAGPDTMMLGFDTDAAKARLESVSWIRHAQVMRLLPSTLQVVIEERAPYAIWQSKGQTYVVDDEGVVLAPAARDAYPELPLVVGDGAGKNAAALFAALKPYDAMKQKMIAALRIGDRRWNLRLGSGIDVMLPDDNVDEALQSLTKLDAERGLLAKKIAAVDLRLLDRVTVRLLAAQNSVPSDAGAASDVPTASTKVAPAKGKT
jgi:cell division protein FtsQ